MGLTVAAGAATAVGAAVVFVPRLVKLASRRTLAGALGLSAGVMTYVSFVEIFNKSRVKFLSAGYSADVAYAYATVCFFGGVVLMTVSTRVSARELARRSEEV
jgi:ZIP family zinc transporter